MMLTLFTPAYNRAHTLPRLYESLLAQTCFDFEWLVIDDGSTDATAEAVKAFTGDGKFPVRYIYKENGGKHTAHNRALEEARGDWFLCLDSDDTLTPTAVAELLSAAKDLPENTGIAAGKTDLSGNSLSQFPQGRSFAKMHALQGEFAYAFPTKWAKQFPFPVFPGERFLGECVVYDRMDTRGQMYLLPKAVMPCEYQAGGYSADFSRLMKQNPQGFCLFFAQRVDLASNWRQRLITAGKYRCFRMIGGKNAPVYSGAHPFSVAAAWPLGLIFRLYYKLLRGF